jgi:hypothetical protein
MDVNKASITYYVDEHDAEGHFVWSSYPIEADLTNLSEAYDAAEQLRDELEHECAKPPAGSSVFSIRAVVDA